MTRETTDAYSNRAIMRRVLHEARPFRLHLGVLFVLSLLSTPLALATPVPLQLAVDSVIDDRPLPGVLSAVVPGSIERSPGAVLAVVTLLGIVIALLTQLRGMASNVLRTYTGEKLVLDFRSRLFRHSQRLSLAYHDTKGTSDSTFRIQHDAPALQWIAVDGTIPFITQSFKLIAMIAVTALISFQLALVAMVISPILFLVVRLYSRRLRGEWRGLRKVESSVQAGVQEALGSVRVVKAFGREDYEQERFLGQAREGVRRQIRVALQESALGLATGLVVGVGTAAVLYIGALQVRSGVLTLGELLLVMAYLSQLYRPLETVSQKVGDLQMSFASAERAFALFDQQPDVPERPHAKRLRKARGMVAFHGVSFRYRPDDTPALERVSFAVEPGTRVGIAGATGAGKTTLVSLLPRFFDPSEGRIELDRVDLRDYRVADLRDQFALVLQEPVLFSTSVADNIAYARPEASVDEIVAAARAANAHDFIHALPEGYYTAVGERGMGLSGGERQRISLARAFLRDASILILDEPTSSVDLKTEAVIMEAMDRLMQDRTTFMIAHRLSTLENCEVRLALEQGRLVDMHPSSLPVAAGADGDGEPSDQRHGRGGTAAGPGNGHAAGGRVGGRRA